MFGAAARRTVGISQSLFCDAPGACSDLPTRCYRGRKDSSRGASGSCPSGHLARRPRHGPHPNRMMFCCPPSGMCRHPSYSCQACASLLWSWILPARPWPAVQAHGLRLFSLRFNGERKRVVEPDAQRRCRLLLRYMIQTCSVLFACLGYVF